MTETWEEDDPMWARVDVNFYMNRKVIEAGEDGASLFLWFLLTNQKHQCDGSLPGRFCSRKVMATELRWSVDRVDAALISCQHEIADFRLLSPRDDGGFDIFGWSDEWRPKAMTGAERIANYRERNRDGTSQVTTAVTTSNNSLLDLRSEIREEDLDPPLTPPGASRDERKRARKAKREISANTAEITAAFVTWFNQRFTTCFEIDSEETQKLVSALLAKGKGKWGLAEMKTVAGFWGDQWRKPPVRGDKDMSIHVRPSAMLRASKFEEKLAAARPPASRQVDSAQVDRLHAAVPELANFLRTGTVTPVAPIRSAAAPQFPVTKGKVAAVQTSERTDPLPREDAPTGVSTSADQARGGPPRKPPVAAFLKGRSS